VEKTFDEDVIFKQTPTATPLELAQAALIKQCIR
jgi:hypothetical protein